METKSQSQEHLPVFYGLPLLDDDGEMRLVSKRDLRELRMPKRGAFTGGFSAGYYNSVSTQSGFEPQSFYSTRSQKAANCRQFTVQAPEDFMDPEDFDVHGIASKTLRTVSDLNVQYDETGRVNASSKALVLLERLGWKRGQGVGPRVAISDRQDYFPREFRNATLAPMDAGVQPLRFVAKLDHHGLGYKGLDSNACSQALSRVTSARHSRSLLPKGHAFGVGVLNESDDEMDAMAFGQDCMDDYDFEIGGDEPAQAVHTHHQLTRSSGDRPEFEYSHKLQTTRLVNTVNENEDAGTNKRKRPSRFDSVNEEKASSDQNRHKRHHVLSLEERGRKLGFSVDHDGRQQLTDWESKMAVKLSSRFEANTANPKEISVNVDEQIEASKVNMNGQLTRTETEWIPEDGTYRIFNLSAPQRHRNVQQPRHNRRFNVFDVLNEDNLTKETQPEFECASTKVLGVAMPEDDMAAAILAQLSEWRNEVAREQEDSCSMAPQSRRPPIDLFKAIFSTNQSDDCCEAGSEERGKGYYGPSLPPGFQEQPDKNAAQRSSCWATPTLDSSLFVEREVYQEDSEEASRWEWASKGFGLSAQTLRNR